MNADKLDTPRELVFTDRAKAHIGDLGLEVWKAIKPALIEIAAMRRVCDHEGVCHIAQTRGEWMRYKNSEVRVRVAFSTTRRRMTVHAVLRRNGDTYNIFEDIWTEETFEDVNEEEAA